ncbi:hypothetical protein FQR65_LT10251 [Abscondita terminalis]|nr:hypothetical protein FQR65_LT10251 [Abscondita terminalis]
MFMLSKDRYTHCAGFSTTHIDKYVFLLTIIMPKKYGEPVVREMYSSLDNVPGRECGTFISPEEGILCASRDGDVGEDEDGILEIKYSRVPPNEVPNHDNFLISDKDTEELKLNKKHRFYRQAVIQLYCSGKSFVDFFVFHDGGESDPYTHFCERIVRTEETDKLWQDIKSKYIRFYMEDLGPELVDPMYPATGQFRQPAYRRDAIRKVEEHAAENQAKKAAAE